MQSVQEHTTSHRSLRVQDEILAALAQDAHGLELEQLRASVPVSPKRIHLEMTALASLGQVRSVIVSGATPGVKRRVWLLTARGWLRAIEGGLIGA